MTNKTLAEVIRAVEVLREVAEYSEQTHKRLKSIFAPFLSEPPLRQKEVQ